MPITPEGLHEDIREMKAQLCEILKALDNIGRHDERISHVEKSLNTMWDKHDCRGIVIDQIRTHQASCPRDQIRWVWWVLVPQSLVLLGLLFSILHSLK